MKSEQDIEQASVKRTTRVLPAVVVVWHLAYIVAERDLIGHSPVIWERFAHIVLSVFILIAAVRSPPSQANALKVFVVTLVPLFVLFWIAQAERTHAGLTWSLFIGQKATLLLIAGLAPGPLWVGLGFMVALALEVSIQASVIGVAASPGEPLLTWVLAATAMWIHYERLRLLSATRLTARLQAENEAWARLAKTLLSIRDLSNTPLQVLELDVATLRKRHPESIRSTDRMERALGRLRKMRDVLQRLESGVFPMALASLDGLAFLERQAGELEAEAAAEWH